MRSRQALLLVLLLFLVPSLARAGVPEAGHSATLPALQPGTLLDAVAGELPSAQHPRGTVIVAASLQTCGPAVLEWDVARGRVARQVCLGLPESNMRLARAGNVLQVLAQGPSRVLVRVDVGSLRVEHRVDLGVGSYSGLFTDGSFTAVASNPRYDQPADAWMMTTVDRDGQVLGRATLRGALGHGPDVEIAVLAGRAFAVVTANPPADPKARLVALNPDATVAKEMLIDTSVRLPTLAPKGNRLLLSLGSELLEVSAELQILGRHATSVRGRLAVSSDGHVLTAEGDVLSDAFTPERSLDPGEGWVHAVLWLGWTPIVVGSSAEVVRRARLHWWDPV
jgi:hypothetical protein